MFKKKIFVKDSKNFFLQNFKLEFHVNDNFKQFLPSNVVFKKCVFVVDFDTYAEKFVTSTDICTTSSTTVDVVSPAVV